MLVEIKNKKLRNHLQVSLTKIGGDTNFGSISPAEIIWGLLKKRICLVQFNFVFVFLNVAKIMYFRIYILCTNDLTL